MRTGKRNIKSGNKFNSFFPKPKGETKVIKRFAQLEDTLELMRQVTFSTLEDTRQIAKVLTGETVRETCHNIWKFCFKYLQYTKDEQGKEQVRRPSRTWMDRERGIDCDCMSVFIGSILSNLNIPFAFRLARYQSPEFEHVYPIAYADQEIIILDAVVHAFDTEVSYSQIKDVKMELQYLNGFESEADQAMIDELLNNEFPIDAQGLIDPVDGIEGKAERLQRRANRKEKRKIRKATKKPIIQRLKEKGLHVINRYNPATATVRAGILASMKLNLFNVANKLRFAYWPLETARNNNMDLAKYNELQRIKEKLEKMFHNAGGKKENLKKAILTGKGNSDRKVSLNGIGEINEFVNEFDRLEDILGSEIFYDEFSEVEHGVDGLGAAGAIIASASALVGTIAGLIKKLGNLFRPGSVQANHQNQQDGQFERNRRLNLFKQSRIQDGGASVPMDQRSSEVMPDDIAMDEFGGEEFEVRNAEADPKDDEQTGFMGWVKKNPMLSAGIALAVVGGTIYLVKRSKQSSVNGTPVNGRKKTKKRKKTGSKKPRRKATSTYKQVKLL